MHRLQWQDPDREACGFSITSPRVCRLRPSTGQQARTRWNFTVEALCPDVPCLSPSGAGERSTRCKRTRCAACLPGNSAVLCSLLLPSCAAAARPCEPVRGVIECSDLVQLRLDPTTGKQRKTLGGGEIYSFKNIYTSQASQGISLPVAWRRRRLSGHRSPSVPTVTVRGIVSRGRGSKQSPFSKKDKAACSPPLTPLLHTSGRV